MVVGGLVLSYLVLRLSWLALCIFFSLPAHLSKLDLKAILFVNVQSLKNQTIELRSTFLHNGKVDGISVVPCIDSFAIYLDSVLLFISYYT